MVVWAICVDNYTGGDSDKSSEAEGLLSLLWGTEAQRHYL